MEEEEGVGVVYEIGFEAEMTLEDEGVMYEIGFDAEMIDEEAGRTE